MNEQDRLIDDLYDACYMARQSLFRPDHPQEQERREEAYNATREAMLAVDKYREEGRVQNVKR